MGERIIKESRNFEIVEALADARFYFDGVKQAFFCLTEPILNVAANAKAVEHFFYIT